MRVTSTTYYKGFAPSASPLAWSVLARPGWEKPFKRQGHSGVGVGPNCAGLKVSERHLHSRLRTLADFERYGIREPHGSFLPRHVTPLGVSTSRTLHFGGSF